LGSLGIAVTVEISRLIASVMGTGPSHPLDELARDSVRVCVEIRLSHYWKAKIEKREGKWKIKEKERTEKESKKR
jgi:hypothetical protein